MPLIIDTFNVLHTVGVLPPDLAGIDIPGLVRLVGASRHRAERMVLVCDGTAPPDLERLRREAGPNVAIRFAGPGRKADDLIAHMVRLSTAPRRLTIVSSDHEVLRSARRRKCRILTSQDFLQQLAQDAQPVHRTRPAPATSKHIPPALTNQQTSAWLKLFNLDDAGDMAVKQLESELAQEAGRTAPESSDLESAGGKRAGAAPGARQGDDARRATRPAPRAAEPPAPVLPDDVIAEAERLMLELDEPDAAVDDGSRS